MPKNVLLTGGSGGVGFEVLKELVKRNDQYRTRVLSIDAYIERDIFRPYLDRVEVISGDIRDPYVVDNAIKGVDVVIHVAGIIPPLADNNPIMAREVNVSGTKNIVDSIKKQQKHPRFIFTSSVAVYGDRLKQPEITINDPLVPSEGDEYARTKIDAEKIIMDSGIPWSIFRLCGILVRNLKIQPLMFHMPLETSLEWCHPSDVAYALVQAINEDKVINQVFNLGGGEQCQIKAKEFVKSMFSIWGLDSSILPEYAFAFQNFHSGFYKDGSILNQILNFQKQTLHGYFDTIRAKVSPLKRNLIKMIPSLIIREYLLRMSDPLNAIKDNNDMLIKRYYGSRQKFYEIAPGMVTKKAIYAG